jgi:transcriptional regulator with XRE-family HTH domain
MDMCKRLGRNAARLRDAAGLTQQALAEKSGFSQQFIRDPFSSPTSDPFASPVSP